MNKHQMGLGDMLQAQNNSAIQSKYSKGLGESIANEQPTEANFEGLNKITQKVEEITQKSSFTNEEVQFIKEFEQILLVMAEQDSRLIMADTKIVKSLITAEVLSGARLTSDEMAQEHANLHKIKQQFGDQSNEYKAKINNVCNVLKQRAKQNTAGKPSSDGLEIAEQFINAKAKLKKELQNEQSMGQSL